MGPKALQSCLGPDSNPSSPPASSLCVLCHMLMSTAFWVGLLRKNVVPHEYRKHFPIEMKDHNSHDVLLLCTSCHAISNYHDNHLKQQLAKEFQAPIGSEEGLRLLEDPERRQVRSGARALLNTENLPAHREEELLQALREFYDTDTVTDEMLQEAASLEIRYNGQFRSEQGLRNSSGINPDYLARTLAREEVLVASVQCITSYLSH